MDARGIINLILVINYLPMGGGQQNVTRVTTIHSELTSTASVLTDASGNTSLSSDHIETCRFRSKYYPIDRYEAVTCASCFNWLFQGPDKTLKYIEHPILEEYLIGYNNGSVDLSVRYRADIKNATIKNAVCSHLDNDGCERWVDCCKDAHACCTKMQESPPSHEADQCPRTWDGWTCWEDTPGGRTVTAPCPSFIKFSILTSSSVKMCNNNGTWHKKAIKGQNKQKEWTDFTHCLDIKSHKVKIYVVLGCLALSLLVLVPSVIIFLMYRSLRSQHRIRLHLNLCFSFILTCFISILWYVVIVHDRLVTPTHHTAMHKNEGWCKFVYVLTRYSSTANFMWMFCEAFYLHRLINNTFEPPKSLWFFYAFGWGFPWLPVIIYTAIKVNYGEDTSCWLNNFGAYEWIIYVPNLVSLVLNLVFLCNILRILLTQLTSHPNEPSNYRRAFRATFILVPLFGLQLFGIIYRPSPLAPYYQVYDIFSGILVNSQGFFVALIFCLLNGEVMSHLRRSMFKRSAFDMKRASSASTQFTTTENFSTATTRNSKPGGTYIAMTPVNERNGDTM